MDQGIIQRAREVASEAVRQAGRIAMERFGAVADVKVKDEYGDVVTEVDLLAEACLVNSIRHAFPEHQIHSEEAGMIGEVHDWLWLVDPLDGTNNYAIALPVFSISMTLMYRREAVLGVVYEPVTDRLFVSVIGQGTTCNQQLLLMNEQAGPMRGNIAWIQGHRVQNDVNAVRLRHLIDVRFKRMLRLWAPTMQWCMLAKGDIDGIVLYNSEGDDLYAGILMVQEAGGIVVDFSGKPFRGMNEEPYLIACHPDHKQLLLDVVNEGLR